MTGAAAPDPEYVAARGVLLDALDALGTQRKAVVLVGAQAGCRNGKRYGCASRCLIASLQLARSCN